MISESSILNSRYRLEKKIGQGGFATVFLATDLLLERRVAVKVLNPELVDDETFLERFGREAKSVAVLDHPNILSIHDFGHSHESAYLVMPYVEGGTLHDKLRRGNRLSLGQTAGYLAQVAAALDYAHRRNIVHRDIKPQNMLLRAEDDRLLLADFGIAKVLNSASTQGRTGVMGTLSYMAPEQINGSVGIATDIYALGCVLFQMLTGQVPFIGQTEQVLIGHLHLPVPSIIERSQGQIPATVQPVIERALAKQSHDRFASAGDLFRAFQAAVQAEPGATRPLDYTPPQPVTYPPVTQPGGAAYPPVSGPVTLPHSQPQPHQAQVQAAGWSPPQGIQPPPSTFNRPEPLSEPPPAARSNRLVYGLAGGALVLALLAIGMLLVLTGQGNRGQAGNNTPAAATASPGSSSTTEAATTEATTTEATTTEAATPDPTTTAEAEPTPTETATPSLAQTGSQTNLPGVTILSGHSGEVAAVGFSRDSKVLATGSFDKSIKVWDLVGGKEMATLTGHTDHLGSLAASPDGKLLASAGDDDTIRLWDTSDGKLLKVLQGHTDTVKSIVFSPDNKTLYSGSADATIKAWDVAAGKEIRTFKGHEGGVWSVALSRDGKTLASGADDGTLRLWETAGGQEVATLLKSDSAVLAVAFDSRSDLLASGSSDTIIRLWDIAGRKEIRSLSGHSEDVLALAFSPDGQRLASGSKDETARLWDPATGRELQVLRGHKGYIWSLSFSPDGKLLATGSGDASARLWQLQNGLALAGQTPTPRPAATATPAAEATPAPQVVTTPAPATVAATTPATPAPRPTTARPATPTAAFDPGPYTNLLASLPGTTSVVVLLPNGQVVEDDAERQLPSASTIKLWIAATFYQESAARKLNPADSYTVKSSDIASGTGILRDNVGKSFTYERLVNIMLVNSDNTAANLIVEKLGGMSRVNEYARRNGYPQTVLQRKLGDVGNPNNNFTSARDAALFLQRLLKGEIVDKASSDRILAALRERRGYAQDQNFFATQLPSGVDYLHISGTGARVRNEVGYIPLKAGAPLIVAILVSDATEETAEKAIASVAAQIYNLAQKL